MSVPLLSREIIETELWRLKCRKVREYEVSALWATRHGYHFIVPQEGPDKCCDKYTWQDILADLAAHEPKAK